MFFLISLMAQLIICACFTPSVSTAIGSFSSSSSLYQSIHHITYSESNRVYTTTTPTNGATAGGSTANPKDTKLPFNGGPVLTGIIPIQLFLLGDVTVAAQAAFTVFLQGLSGSAWWNIISSRYGGGKIFFNNSINSSISSNSTIFIDASIHGNNISPELYLINHMTATNQTYSSFSIYLFILGTNAAYGGYGISSCGYHTYLQDSITSDFVCAVSVSVMPRSRARCYFLKSGLNLPHGSVIDNTINVIARK